MVLLDPGEDPDAGVAFAPPITGVVPADETTVAARHSHERSATLAVPSVVTPGEWNLLLNPAHSHFPRVQIGPFQRFRPDPRLLR